MSSWPLLAEHSEIEGSVLGENGEDGMPAKETECIEDVQVATLWIRDKVRCESWTSFTFRGPVLGGLPDCGLHFFLCATRLRYANRLIRSAPVRFCVSRGLQLKMNGFVRVSETLFRGSFSVLGPGGEEVARGESVSPHASIRSAQADASVQTLQALTARFSQG